MFLSFEGDYYKKRRSHHEKLIALLLALTLVVTCFAACGKSKDSDESTTAPPAGNTKVEGLSEEEYKKMTAEALLQSAAKDVKAVTGEKFAWLVSTFVYVNIVDKEDDAQLYLAENITGEAINLVEKKPSQSEYFDKILASEYPQVRGYALSQMASLFGVSNENVAKSKRGSQNRKRAVCALLRD